MAENTALNMRIAGKGTVPPGEYGKVSISGSGRLFGEVRCNEFSASGASKGESITCAEHFKVSGTSSFSGQVKAKDVRTAGSFSCNGALVAEEQLRVSGSLRVGGDLQATDVRIAGGLQCGGTLRAARIALQADKRMSLGSIAGGNVHIRRKTVSIFFKRRTTVASAIEGDELDLAYVTAPQATGRTVIIGKGCRIDLVQYSEKVEIAPKAKIGRVEKIEQLG